MRLSFEIEYIILPLERPFFRLPGFLRCPMGQFWYYLVFNRTTTIRTSVRKMQRIQNMRYETLQLSCECGQTTTRIREVGFTADHQLVLHWRCLACKKYVYVV